MERLKKTLVMGSWILAVAAGGDTTNMKLFEEFEPGFRGHRLLDAPRLDPSRIQQSDRGFQYVSIRYTERLDEAGIEPSVSSVGDSSDNAMAETIFALFKAEVIWPNGPWRSLEGVAFATLEWVD